jgi:hypothetical protein
VAGTVADRPQVGHVLGVVLDRFAGGGWLKWTEPVDERQRLGHVPSRVTSGAATAGPTHGDGVVESGFHHYQEVRGTVPTFPSTGFTSTESPRSSDMLKVFAFLTKREDIDTRAFIEYYETHHVPLVLSLAPTPTVYKRNYVVRGDEFNREDDSIDFDVITELVFPDRDAYVAWIEKLAVEAIGADEGMFLDRSRTRAYVIEEHVTAA